MEQCEIQVDLPQTLKVWVMIHKNQTQQATEVPEVSSEELNGTFVVNHAIESSFSANVEVTPEVENWEKNILSLEKGKQLFK